MQTKHKDMISLLRIHENKKKNLEKEPSCTGSQLWLLTLMCSENALGMQFSDRWWTVSSIQFFSILVTPKALSVDFLHVSSLDINRTQQHGYLIKFAVSTCSSRSYLVFKTCAWLQQRLFKRCKMWTWGCKKVVYVKSLMQSRVMHSTSQHPNKTTMER